MVVNQFDVVLAPLEPTTGHEMGKTRPVLIISPDVMNHAVRTVIVAPMTSTRKKFPYRVNCTFQGRDGQIALDQMRALDKSRFVRHLGKLDRPTANRVRDTLLQIFR